MHRPFCAALAAALFTAIATIGALAPSAPAESTDVFSPDSAVVGYEDGADASVADRIAREGGVIVAGVPILRFYVVSTPDPVRLVANLAGAPGVRYAERDPFVRPEQALPAVDQYYSNRWGMPAIRAPEAWMLSRGAGAVVAVLDTGVQHDYPDLLLSTWVNVDEIPGNRLDDDGNGYVGDHVGWDFNGNANDPRPGSCGQHGTHVAGIVAATQNNVIGVTGVAPLAKVMALRTICSSGHLSAAALAVAYAASNGANVVTCSWYATYRLTAFEDAVRWAYASQNVLFVKSAGNQYGGPVTYPGTLPEYLAVSSLDSSLAPSSFSSRGTKVELAAPGGSVYSTYGTNGYSYLSGTSMAAPHVAGTAALIYAKSPGVTNLAVRAALDSSARDLGAAGRDPSFGFGMVDAARALAAV